MSRSNDGCKIVQKSVIFHYISRRDTEVEIMCESGYDARMCGKSGINLTISIPTASTNNGQ